MPSTPNSELAKKMRKVAEDFAECGVKFKIVEKGGITLGRMLQRPNPFSSGTCAKPDCTMCEQGGRSCHKMNVAYQYECIIDKSAYNGETARNFYTRNLEHTDKFVKKKPDSFMYQHQLEAHGGSEPDFNVKILKSFKDPMSRQIYEGVKIRRSNSTLNSKLEYYQQSTYNIRREIGHG